MSVPAIRAFLEGPYGIVDDVKMLNFFRFLGLTGGIVMSPSGGGLGLRAELLVPLSLPVRSAHGCRRTASPLRIRRDAALCIDCAKCARACPAALPVDRLVTIRSAECTGCLECVAACPASGALFLNADVGQTIVMRRLPTVTPIETSKRVPSWAIAAGIALIFPQRVFLRPLDRPLEHGPPRPRLLRPDSPRQRIPAPITQHRRTALRGRHAGLPPGMRRRSPAAAPTYPSAARPFRKYPVTAFNSVHSTPRSDASPPVILGLGAAGPPHPLRRGLHRRQLLGIGRLTAAPSAPPFRPMGAAALLVSLRRALPQHLRLPALRRPRRLPAGVPLRRCRRYPVGRVRPCPPDPAKPLPPLPKLWKYTLIVAFSCYFLVYFLNALAPEVSPDGAGYHLGNVARDLRQNGFVWSYRSMYSAFPQGMEMLFLVAFAFGRHSSAALVHFTFLAALPALIVCYGRRFGLIRAAAFAAVLVFASPLFGVVGTSAYNDVALVPCSFAVFYCLEVWDEEDYLTG